ncbi:MAG: hypothetical protein ACTS73_02120 [Arsenophonus sp. NEOnobi-MAG3]
MCIVYDSTKKHSNQHLKIPCRNMANIAPKVFHAILGLPFPFFSKMHFPVISSTVLSGNPTTASYLGYAKDQEEQWNLLTHSCNAAGG